MNLKSANRWQNILLFGGFVIGMVGIAVLDNLYIAILGLAMMAMSHRRVVDVPPLPLLSRAAGPRQSQALPEMRRVDRRRAGARGEEKIQHKKKKH